MNVISPPIYLGTDDNFSVWCSNYPFLFSYLEADVLAMRNLPKTASRSVIPTILHNNTEDNYSLCFSSRDPISFLVCSKKNEPFQNFETIELKLLCPSLVSAEG